MIGLVLVTHGGLARELLKAAEHVCGPQEQAEVVCFEADDDLTARTKDIQDAAARADTGAGLIFLTDVYGATPFNAALAAANFSGIPVIAGVNVPMLLKLVSARKTDDIDAAVIAAKEAGQKHICVSETAPTENGGASNGGEMSGAALTRTVTIDNELGLHARPAARFVALAGTFEAEVTVTKDGETVPGTSILGLLMFGAAPGSELEIAATGPEAEAALDALEALVKGGLGDKPGPDG